MSAEGIRALRVAAADAFDVAAELNAEQWTTPSAAEGWSVKDVFIHLGSLLELLQAAVNGAESPPLGIEAINEQVVAERRNWTSSVAIQFLRDQLDSGLELFSSLQSEPLASTTTQMLDLGTYPLHAIADMFAFDFVTHLRYDVLAPRGPIALSVPDLDEDRMSAAISWLMGGLEQMQPALAARVTSPLALVLTGPGGRSVLLDGRSGTLTVTEPPTTVPAAATVISTTEDFLAWSTKRAPWASAVRVDGDLDLARGFLNAVNLT
ncbi:MAG: maleylpyruvate isomerase N-terminal domain-containing protein [Mycobacterium sp.]